MSRISRYNPIYLAAVSAVLLAFCLPVRADLIVSLTSITATAGSTGNALEVLLTNTGPSTVTIGGFSFELVSSSVTIDFTEANTAAVSNPYIFDGQSLFGPTISTTQGQALDASDLYAVIGSGTSLGSGVTVALGHVLFDVSANATTQSVDVTLSGFPSTSLSDENGGNISVSALNKGSISVTGTTVAEPRTLGLVISGVGLLAPLRRRKRI